MAPLSFCLSWEINNAIFSKRWNWSWNGILFGKMLYVLKAIDILPCLGTIKLILVSGLDLGWKKNFFFHSNFAMLWLCFRKRNKFCLATKSERLAAKQKFFAKKDVLYPDKIFLIVFTWFLRKCFVSRHFLLSKKPFFLGWINIIFFADGSLFYFILFFWNVRGSCINYVSIG